MDKTPAALYLEDVAEQFRSYKRLADRALEQVRDEDLLVTLDPESNSLAVLIQHMAGNLISRWTDFLTTDGEKPDRDRDSEFETRDGTTRAALLARNGKTLASPDGTQTAIGSQTGITGELGQADGARRVALVQAGFPANARVGVSGL